MPYASKSSQGEWWLRPLLLSYLAASLLHFAHNAEYLSSYPNLPPWISRASIYITWLGVATVGCYGYWLYRKRRSLIGLVMMGLCAAGGLGGLLHYTRAPWSAHSAAMNFSILLEATFAAALLAAIMIAGFQRRPRDHTTHDQRNE